MAFSGHRCILRRDADENASAGDIKVHLDQPRWHLGNDIWLLSPRTCDLNM